MSLEAASIPDLLHALDKKLNEEYNMLRGIHLSPFVFTDSLEPGVSAP